MGTITTIMLKFNVNLYQTQNANETAEFILALAKKEQKKDKKTFSIRFKKVPEKLKEKLEYIVAGIPGINVSRARDLLYEFDTIQNLFNASEEELQDVHNIGPKIAQKIKKYAESHYRL